MEYSAEDAYMMNDKESMNPVHHIVDDTSEDDPRWDDEHANDNAKVVTWFTFYSHRAQREYYYEPISGTTTWIAPSQTTTEAAEEDDECVISRLPGSPLETVREDATRLYEKRVIPVITRRPVALFLFLSNMVLFAALWQSFRHGITLPEVANVWILEAQSAVSLFTSSNVATPSTPIMDDSSSEEEDSVSNIHLEEADTPEMALPDDTLVVGSDTPPEEVAWVETSDTSDDLENESREVLLVPDDNLEDDATKDISPIENGENAESEMEDALVGGVDDALVEEKDEVDDVIVTSSFVEVLEDDPEEAMEIVDITIDAVTAETDIVSPSVEEEDVVLEDDDSDAESNLLETVDTVDDVPLETVDVVEEEKDETESPVDIVDPPESSIEEEVVSSEDADDATVVDALEIDLEETLHRIQKEGDLLVQRVALVATKRGFSIELEPNLTAGFTHAPLELLLQEGGAAVV